MDLRVRCRLRGEAALTGPCHEIALINNQSRELVEGVRRIMEK